MGSVSKCQHIKKREDEKKNIIVKVKFRHNKCNCTLLPFYNIVALKFYCFSPGTALHHHHPCCCREDIMPTSNNGVRASKIMDEKMPVVLFFKGPIRDMTKEMYGASLTLLSILIYLWAHT